MKFSSGLTQKELSSILGVLKKHPEVEEAILFGSRAKGNHKRGSDVDIALRGAEINRESIAAISHELNEETFMPYHFDLLNFNSLSNQDLIDHIIRVGTKIYGHSSQNFSKS